MLSELLALIGLSWSRVLLYPGGLTALILAWIWHGSWTKSWLSLNWRLIPAAFFARRVVAAVPPLLLLSLLPLPGATSLARSIDVPTALVLLEWPLVLALLPALARNPFSQKVVEERLGELQIGYGVLILAVLASVQATRSFSLDALVAPTEQPDLVSRALRIGGAIAWALALPPLLGIGAFEHRKIADIPWGDELRVIGHCLLAALPWLALTNGLPWLSPLPPLLIALLLAAVHHFGQRGQRTWMWTLRGAAFALLALLTWAAATNVATRLQ